MRPFIFSEALGFSLLSLYVNPALSDPIHILTVSTPILVCHNLANDSGTHWLDSEKTEAQLLSLRDLFSPLRSTRYQSSLILIEIGRRDILTTCWLA